MPIRIVGDDGYYHNVIFSDCSDDSQNIVSGETRIFMTSFGTYQFFNEGKHRLIIDYNKSNKTARVEMQMAVNLN